MANLFVLDPGTGQPGAQGRVGSSRRTWGRFESWRLLFWETENLIQIQLEHSILSCYISPILPSFTTYNNSAQHAQTGIMLGQIFSIIINSCYCLILNIFIKGLRLTSPKTECFGANCQKHCPALRGLRHNHGDNLLDLPDGPNHCPDLRGFSLL